MVQLPCWWVHGWSWPWRTHGGFFNGGPHWRLFDSCMALYFVVLTRLRCFLSNWLWPSREIGIEVWKTIFIVEGRMMIPIRGHVLTLRTCENNHSLWQRKIKILMSWPWDGEIILGNLGELNVITGSLKVKEGGGRTQYQRLKETRKCYPPGFEGGEGHHPKTVGDF